MKDSEVNYWTEPHKSMERLEYLFKAKRGYSLSDDLHISLEKPPMACGTRGSGAHWQMKGVSAH